jgi:hypothetical protein
MNFDCDLTLPLGLLWATKPNELMSMIKNLYLEPSLCRIPVKRLDLGLSLISTTTYPTWVWLIFYPASPLSLNLGTSMKSMFLERKKEPWANELMSMIKNLYLEPSLCRIPVKWLDLGLSLISSTTYLTWVWLIFYPASPLSLNLGTSMKLMYLERKKEPWVNFCETKSDSCRHWVPLMPGKNHALGQSMAYLSICLKSAKMICSLLANRFIVHLKLDWWVISGDNISLSLVYIFFW